MIDLTPSYIPPNHNTTIYIAVVVAFITTDNITVDQRSNA